MQSMTWTNIFQWENEIKSVAESNNGIYLVAASNVRQLGTVFEEFCTILIGLTEFRQECLDGFYRKIHKNSLSLLNGTEASLAKIFFLFTQDCIFFDVPLSCA